MTVNDMKTIITESYLEHLQNRYTSATTVANIRPGRPDEHQWHYIARKRKREDESALGESAPMKATAELHKLGHLIGRVVYDQINDPDTDETICRAGQMVTLEIAQQIRSACLLDDALKSSVRITFGPSAADDDYWERVDYEYESARDREIENTEEEKEYDETISSFLAGTGRH